MKNYYEVLLLLQSFSNQHAFLFVYKHDWRKKLFNYENVQHSLNLKISATQEMTDRITHLSRMIDKLQFEILFLNFVFCKFVCRIPRTYRLRYWFWIWCFVSLNVEFHECQRTNNLLAGYEEKSDEYLQCYVFNDDHDTFFCNRNQKSIDTVAKFFNY